MTHHDKDTVFIKVMKWISATPVGAPPPVRGLIRFVPPLPRAVHRELAPPLGPWPAVDVAVPDALRGPAGSSTDPDLQRAAMEAEPLRTFGQRFPKTVAWTNRAIWRVRVPMLPRWLRATAASRHTGRVTPVRTTGEVDVEALDAGLRAKAAELGISMVGVAAYDPRYSMPTYDPAVSGDRIVICILEQPWGATQQIPSVKAELGALTTYTSVVRLACELAGYLHEQGFRAQAFDNAGPHLAIPYAVNAGLGQLGLNGQLLTLVAGPRCRVVAMSTNAPLTVGEPRDFGVTALCDACHACVERCPSGAIPVNRKMHRGVEKAKINSKRCLPVVAKAEGCGVCMKVCPAQRYGLQPVLDEFERSGTVMGRGTDELEGYTWPLTGEHMAPGQRPRLRPAFFEVPGGEDIY